MKKKREREKKEPSECVYVQDREDESQMRLRIWHESQEKI